MNKQFQTIGLMSRQRNNEGALHILETLIQFLNEKNKNIVLEKETANLLFGMDSVGCDPSAKYKCYALEALGKHSDLIIVVGGDGALLQAARAVVEQDKPIVGINRGYLGFLADIHPHEIHSRLEAILAGDYREEKRFLLNAFVEKNPSAISTALNDVVLLPDQVAHMIEFEIFIDDQFVSKQRADGLIVATPTGSTAYALSGGGPILHPDLDAIVLVPMFPHTLTSRPLVVSGNSRVVLRISKEINLSPRLSCDGQAHIELNPGDSIVIQKKAEKLRLIHPLDYDYFDTLRVKLRWG